MLAEAFQHGIEAKPRQRRRQIASFDILYAHAIAIAREAEARCNELATLMADYGNDTTAGLFLRLADSKAQSARNLAMQSKGIAIPIIDSAEHAWLDHGASTPEARAFIFRMMTPRMALGIALRAEEQAKAFFEAAQVESSNAIVRELAAEFAHEGQSPIDWVNDALADLPKPFLPDEELLGDPTIEQQV